MVGRAAQGRPWLCGQIATHLATGITPPPPSPACQFGILRRHVADLHDFYGDYMGLRIARKHVGWYLGARYGNGTARSDFNALDSCAAQLQFIDQIIRNENNEVQAA